MLYMYKFFKLFFIYYFKIFYFLLYIHIYQNLNLHISKEKILMNRFMILQIMFTYLSFYIILHALFIW